MDVNRAGMNGVGLPWGPLPAADTLFGVLGTLSKGLARLVGLVFVALGMWVVVVNLVEFAYSGWTLVSILAAGALGSTGGVLYLLSFGDRARFTNRRTRLIGWIGMLVLALLPSSLSFPLLAMLLATAPTLLMPFRRRDDVAVS